MMWAPRTFVRLLMGVLLLGFLPLVRAAAPMIRPFQAPAVHFLAMDVELDSGATPVAAYQVELNTGAAVLVGVEGGEPAAFREAPYYDPRALRNNRIILAAFSLAQPGTLPHGQVRVARVHLEVSGAAAADVTVKKVLATDAQGNSIQASVRCERSAAN